MCKKGAKKPARQLPAGKGKSKVAQASWHVTSKKGGKSNADEIDVIMAEAGADVENEPPTKKQRIDKANDKLAGDAQENRRINSRAMWKEPETYDINWVNQTIIDKLVAAVEDWKRQFEKKDECVWSPNFDLEVEELRGQLEANAAAIAIHYSQVANYVDTDDEQLRLAELQCISGLKICERLGKILKYCRNPDNNRPGSWGMGTLKIKDGELTGRPPFHSETETVYLKNAPGDARRHVAAWHNIRAFLSKNVLKGVDREKLIGIVGEELESIPQFMLSDIKNSINSQRHEPEADAHKIQLSDNEKVMAAAYAMNSNPKNLWLGLGKENSEINVASMAVQTMLRKLKSVEDLKVLIGKYTHGDVVTKDAKADGSEHDKLKSVEELPMLIVEETDGDVVMTDAKADDSERDQQTTKKAGGQSKQKITETSKGVAVQIIGQVLSEMAVDADGKFKNGMTDAQVVKCATDLVRKLVVQNFEIDILDSYFEFSAKKGDILAQKMSLPNATPGREAAMLDAQLDKLVDSRKYITDNMDELMEVASILYRSTHLEGEMPVDEEQLKRVLSFMLKYPADFNTKDAEERHEKRVVNKEKRNNAAGKGKKRTAAPP